MREFLFMLHVFLAEDPKTKYLLYGAETSLLFCNDIFSLWLESVWDDLQHDFIVDKVNGSIVLAQL